jgi:hypothetical protein
MSHEISDREFKQTAKEVLGIDNIKSGWQYGSIKKVNLADMSGESWLVQIFGETEAQWMYNIASVIKTPRGNVQNHLLYPSENLQVYVMKNMDEELFAIIGYVEDIPEILDGTARISKDNGIIEISDGLIHIRLPTSSIKIEDGKITLKAETISLEGNIQEVH